MPGIELLRVASQRFRPWAECEVSQAAFFELGEFAADIIGRTGYDSGHAVLAAKRNTDPGAGQSLLADKRAKGVGQLNDSLLRVKRIGFLAPANRSSDDAVAGGVLVGIAR